MPPKRRRRGIGLLRQEKVFLVFPDKRVWSKRPRTRGFGPRPPQTKVCLVELLRLVQSNAPQTVL